MFLQLRQSNLLGACVAKEYSLESYKVQSVDQYSSGHYHESAKKHFRFCFFLTLICTKLLGAAPLTFLKTTPRDRVSLRRKLSFQASKKHGLSNQLWQIFADEALIFIHTDASGERLDAVFLKEYNTWSHTRTPNRASQNVSVTP